jgi:hypothetical protein
MVGHRRIPRTFRADRVCEAEGCSTRLSIYNDGSSCSAHGPHRPWAAPRRDVAAVLALVRPEDDDASALHDGTRAEAS